MIVFTILLTIYLVQFIIGLLLISAYFKGDAETDKAKINGVSVLIPFKNEVLRIEPLLKSILGLNIPDGFEVEFIFVDDNSSDNGANVVEDYLDDKVVLVKSKGIGKKAAIKTGVELAKFDFVLTLDADVSISSNYFKAISELEKADMWILPVRLTGKKLIQRLGAIEFVWLQLLGISLAKYLNPFLCNGANLLFRKKTFEALDETRTDYEIASGDDMFLLEAMRKADADIHASSKFDLIAFSEGPESFSALRLQRSRWINKMKGRSTFRDFFLAGMQAFFVGGMFLVFFQLDFLPWILLPLGLKITNEFLLLQAEKRFKEPLIDLVVVLAHQVWYLIYLVAMLWPSKKKEARWV